MCVGRENANDDDGEHHMVGGVWCAVWYGSGRETVWKGMEQEVGDGRGV